MKQSQVTITAREVVENQVWLRVSGAEAGIELRPGQFCMVRCGNGWMPYLRRALYPAQIGAAAWVWAIEAEQDPGLEWLANRNVGEQVDCLGPCGNGFTLNADAPNLLLVAEPKQFLSLLPLVELGLAQRHQVTLLTNASEEQVYPAARLPLDVEYRVIAPTAGQSFWQALVRPLAELLQWSDQVCAVGSAALYSVLRGQIEQQKIALPPGFCQVLSEATFGCGFGACLSCVVELRSGHRRACLRGPVFDLNEFA